MHDNAALIEQRIDRFLQERIAPAVYRRTAPLTIEAWHAPGEPVPFADAVGRRFEQVGPGHRWGPPWGTTWFHVTGAIPTAWRRDDGTLPEATRAVVLADLGFTARQPGFQAEGLAYAPDGTVVTGISPLNHAIFLPEAAHGGAGDQIDLYVEAASNPDVMGESGHFAPTPLGEKHTAGDEPLYTVRQIAVALRDETVWLLQQDLAALSGLMTSLPAEATRRTRIRRAIENALDRMDPHDVAGTAEAGRHELAGVLAVPAPADAHRVTAVGHAHIDSAWLWPARETVRKCARTFANVLDLMDRHSDFVFACSSAQQYAWIRDHYPALYARIRQRVAEGRFIPVGSMWVESDTNMPGGEAMVRQFVSGKRFFLEEFGVETTGAWLPDSFGYSGALPQIVALAGADWFLSQKMSWNETNAFPHHTFWWEGIDGTRVFTHFPPVDTYNSDLSAAELRYAERNFRDKAGASESLAPFGFGDGGGGPTEEMIASAHRFADLDGVPRVTMRGPEEFFADARAEYPDAPAWSGEMYLEFHRGTYTSQHRTKAGNRRSEHLLREAELWAATAAVRDGAEYPYEDLERQWHTVLLNQFHDILPGSSIGWVHRQAEETYAEVARSLEEVIDRAARALVGEGDVALRLNAAPHDRDGVAALGIDAVARAADGGPGTPGLTVRTAGDGSVHVANGLVEVEFTTTGQIRRLYDIAARREVLAPGRLGNLLQLHRDTPRQWDAWDIDEEYRRVRTDLIDAESFAVVEQEADRVTLEAVHTFGDSRLVQQITLRRGSPAIEIVTHIDWHERQKLLKLAFPLDVHADRSVAETQFGHVFRPTHANTSWDAARFEICAHRWVHVAEPGYGVAVTNDCTYGHDVQRGVGEDGGTVTTVRLSLVRAPLFPDPEADQGYHRLVTVLHPGARLADAVREGYRTNLPVRTVRGGRAVAPLVSVDEPAVVIEAVKLAEDRSGDVVVRLYESLGGRARARVAFDFPHESVSVVDLLERERENLPHAVVQGAPEAGGGHVELELRPFQIVTLRVRRPG